MTMTTYTCPTCNETMERDLMLFTRHTQDHIAAEITKCHERRSQKHHFRIYYKWNQFFKPDALRFSNIQTLH